MRTPVTDTISSGASRHEAAELFDIAVSTAVKWMQRLRDTGSSEAKPRGGSVSRLEKHTAEILAVVAERPDAILKEILAVLRKQGIRTSRSALWRFLERHNITRKKKSLQAAEQHREDVARARRKWIREQGLLDPARLVFIDETSVNTSMVRLYSRPPWGAIGRSRTVRRLGDHDLRLGTAPRQNGGPAVFKGAMNGEMFLAYVEQCLVPTLQPKDLVVIDNVPIHEVAGLTEAIEATGAAIRFLPKYSPDLNPIELPFSKFKACLRKLAERTVPGVHRAIHSFLLSLKPQECANYLRHAGYVSI